VLPHRCPGISSTGEVYRWGMSQTILLLHWQAESAIIIRSPATMDHSKAFSEHALSLVVGEMKRRLILSALGVAVFLGGFLGRQPEVAGTVAPGNISDAEMYWIRVERVRAGEPYYDVCAQTLREFNYARRPFFHWRLPTLTWLLAVTYHPMLPRIIIAALALTMSIRWAKWLKQYESKRIAYHLCYLGGAPLAGLVLKSHPWFTHHEIWAGVLIGLSLVVHRRRPTLAVLLGLVALFIRELALLYVLLMLAWSSMEGRKKESFAWSLGLVAFAAFFAWHIVQVQTHLVPNDMSDPGWARFPGWPQAVACANWLFVGRAPYWLAGSVLVLALFGPLYMHDYRLFTILAFYTAAFEMVGKPFNHYWGIVYTPLLAVGLGYSACGVYDLLCACHRGPTIGSSVSCCPTR
jgi:hypothetical protein